MNCECAGIIHRDLKLENFLFVNKSPDSDLKMIDFGLSKHFDLGQVHTEMVGTPYTVAPEIIRGTYDEKCDIWALGVITYLLLSGETPFGGLDGENMLMVRQNIIRGQLSFKPADVWAKVSNQGKAFVRKLLQADPHKRPTAKDAQKDEWIQVWAKKVRLQDLPGQLEQYKQPGLSYASYYKTCRMRKKEKNSVQKRYRR